MNTRTHDGGPSWTAGAGHWAGDPLDGGAPFVPLMTELRRAKEELASLRGPEGLTHRPSSPCSGFICVHLRASAVNSTHFVQPAVLCDLGLSRRSLGEGGRLCARKGWFWSVEAGHDANFFVEFLLEFFWQGAGSCSGEAFLVDTPQLEDLDF